MLVCHRMEVAAKVRKDLISMSDLCYPHGEPSLCSMEELVSNNDWDFVEDELLDILFRSNK